MSTIKSENALRSLFWASHPQFKRRMVRIGNTASGHRAYRQATQNEYPTDIRVAFVDFVDQMATSGDISELLADSATL